jgi:hypothetical protein
MISTIQAVVSSKALAAFRLNSSPGAKQLLLVLDVEWDSTKSPPQRQVMPCLLAQDLFSKLNLQVLGSMVWIHLFALKRFMLAMIIPLQLMIVKSYCIAHARLLRHKSKSFRSFKSSRYDDTI